MPADTTAPTTAAIGTPRQDPETSALDIAVNHARNIHDSDALGLALLDLARHHLGQSRPRQALIALDEALALASLERRDRLGHEASLLAAEAYEAQGNEAMAARSRQNAELYQQRLDRSTAPPADEAIAAEVAQPTADTTVPAAANAMPITHGNDSPESRKPWAWLLLPVFVLLAWAWRRSQRKAEALEEETERLARHQRQLKSAHQNLQQQAQQLRETATHDPLTGVLTRKAFASAFEELARHAQHYGKPVTLMVFDLDHFKAINDSHGHLVGDAALKLVVGVVREKLDSDDLFGRFGGDEFLVGCMDLLPAQALDLAEAIRAAVKRHAETGDEKLAVLSLSIGVANTDAAQGHDAAGLFNRADAALYAAKRAGRNRAMLADAATAAGGAQFPLRSLAAE